MSSPAPRVLHVAAGNLFGGVESFQISLARHRTAPPPAESRFGVCFPGRLRDELTLTGAAVADLGRVRFLLPWQVWLARRHLAAILRRDSIGAVVVHSGWSHAIHGPAAVRAGIPLVRWIHAPVSFDHALERPARRVPVTRWIANSGYSARLSEALLGLPPMDVIHCPVEPPVAPTPAAVAHARRELNAGPSDVVVFVAARFEPWKGIHVLIDALGALRDAPHWVLRIAGGGASPAEVAYADQLKVAVAAAGIPGRVQFLGPRRDIPALLPAVDIYCQPNVSPEPFGISFVEALYAGVPVLTSASGGALEVIQDDCGCLIPPGDRPALVNTLSRWIADPALRKRLGAAGPARARFISDPVQQVGRAHRIFREVTGG